MKNRREFLHLSSLGFLSPLIEPAQISSIAQTEISKAVVNQPEDGEVFYVRENTPITIQISKQRDAVESISLCTEEIQPGGKIPVHKHLGEDEFFLFQKGNGIIEIDSIEFPVKAGTSGLVPRATWHSIRNGGTEVLTFIFGYSPAGFEDFFRKIGTAKGLLFKAKSPEEYPLTYTRLPPKSVCVARSLTNVTMRLNANVTTKQSDG